MSFYKQLEDLIRVNSNGRDLTLVQILAEIGTPSTSIAVLDNGEITTHCISDLDHNDETLFQACSISKAIANLAFMRLIEEGYFVLEDKIIDRLPAEIARFLTQDPRTREQVAQITIKHLMSHTAGLSVHAFHGYPDHDNVPSAMETVEGRAPACTQAIKLVTIPGLEFMYSGGGIQLLQYVAEYATHRRLPELVKAYVLEPLGMTRSFYEIDTERERNFASPYSTGTTKCPSGWHRVPELAAAGLWTTPKDLLKAVRGVQMSLRGISGGLLSKASTETMLTSIKSTMALSWFANSSAFGHSGSNDPGYTCMHFGYADLPWNGESKENGNSSCGESDDISLNCGIAVMTNSVQGIKVLWKILHAVAYLKGWTHVPLFIGRSEAWVPFEASGSLSHDDWKQWLGEDWTDGWRLSEGHNGQPVVGLHGTPGWIALRPAAIVAKRYEGDRRSIDLVLEGRAMMLRLGWDESEAMIEVWNGNTASTTTLRREK